VHYALTHDDDEIAGGVGEVVGGAEVGILTGGGLSAGYKQLGKVWQRGGLAPEIAPAGVGPGAAGINDPAFSPVARKYLRGLNQGDDAARAPAAGAASAGGAGLDDLAALRSDLGLAAGEGTLARLDIGGQRFYGISGHGQTYARPGGVTFQSLSASTLFDGVVGTIIEGVPVPVPARS
jgi:hypothetical protein